jgi:flagellar hook-basal body complex protein FliE
MGVRAMKIGQYDLGMNAMMKEMNALKVASHNNFTQDIQPDRNAINPSSANFGDMLSKAIDNVSELGHESKNKATAFEMGDQSVSLADVMIAKEKSGVAFEATLHVRNKILEAYEKIMQMPV